MKFIHCLSIMTFIVSFAGEVSAWTTPPSSTVMGGKVGATTRSSTTQPAVLRLHPDQASELAACAYDLMKQTKQEEGEVQLLSRDISKKLRLDEEKNAKTVGPVSWARKRLFQQFGRNTNKAALPQQQQQHDVIVSQDVKPGLMP